MTLIGTTNVIETADSSYADYADNFDLSLLSMDNEFNTLISRKLMNNLDFFLCFFFCS